MGSTTIKLETPTTSYFDETGQWNIRMNKRD